MMGPIEAISTGLGKYWTLSGRAGRAEYWWFAGFLLGVGIVCGYFQEIGRQQNDGQLVVIATLVTIAFFPCAVGATRRRQRDVNPNVSDVSFFVCFGAGVPPYYNRLDMFRMFGCTTVGILLLFFPAMIRSALLRFSQPDFAVQPALSVLFLTTIAFGWPLPNLLRPSAKETKPKFSSPTGNEVQQ